MSKKNNVNPDHYKESGRTRQGDDILQNLHKQDMTQTPPHLNTKHPVGPLKEELNNDPSGETKDGAQAKK